MEHSNRFSSCIECMPLPSDDTDHSEEYETAVDFWLIQRYNLMDDDSFFEFYTEEDEQFKQFGMEAFPDYVVRLLPWFFHEFTGDQNQNYALDVSNFEDIFVILTIFTHLDKMLHLPDDEDIRYVYFELSTKFCEWLTTEELVMQYFNQKKKIEHYKTGYGVGSQRVSFDYEKYLESVWAESKRVLMEMSQDMSEIFEIDTLDRLEKGTRNESVLLKSIDEWFLTIKISEQSIGSILEKDGSPGVYSHGFRRFTKIDPRYRLMIYSSLIRQIYAHNSITCLIFNPETNNRLRELVSLGVGALNDRNKKFLDFDEWFSEDDIIYDFQMLSQTSSLFLEPDTIEIFHHCSSMEKMQSHLDVWSTLDLSFKRSITTKYSIAMSSLDKNAQSIFQGMIDSFPPKSTSTANEPDKLAATQGIQQDLLQYNAMLLKQSMRAIIGDIKPNTGKSATKRLKNYQILKKRHISLYKQLGIPTSIQSINRRGRRTEILFYHQNRDTGKLENEIKYIPKSLNQISELFHDTNVVISAPYLVLMTLSHVLQFTLCVNSLGSFSDKKIIVVFEDSLGNCLSVLSKWGFSTWPLTVIRNSFKNEDATEVLKKIDRGKIIEIQNEIKYLFESMIDEALSFPVLVPPELSPHFGQ